MLGQLSMAFGFIREPREALSPSLIILNMAEHRVQREVEISGYEGREGVHISMTPPA